jgi:hypothetical protein
MRLVGWVAALALAVGILAGGSGAGLTFHYVWFIWNGHADGETLSYGFTEAKHWHLLSEVNENAFWHQGCVESIPAYRWPVRSGTAVLCKPADTLVAGSIDEQEMDNPDRSCSATASARPGYPAVPIGGTVDGSLLKPLDTAPIFYGVSIHVDQNGNPLGSGCTGFGFWSKGDFNSFDMRGVSGPWGQPRTIPKKWTDQQDYSTAGGAEFQLEHFSANLVVSFSANDSETAPYTLLDALTLLQGWLEKKTNNQWQGTVHANFGDAGRVDVFADAEDPITVFTIHQSVHKGSNSLAVNLTPQGRNYLLTDPAPLLYVTVSFTPTGGSKQSLSATISPPVEPTISTVTFTGSQANPTIVVTGRELTPLPPRDPAGSPVGHNGCPSKPGDYGSDYGGLFNLEDISGNWSAGLNAGTITSCIGIIATNVSPGEIDFHLGSFYTGFYPQFKLSPGDDVELLIDGAPAEVHVRYGSPITP